MLAVHVHMLEAATRRPTPVRLRIFDAKGNHFAPLGASVDFPCGRGEDVGGRVRIHGEKWFIIDGRCEVKLPAGEPLTIEASKGFEYTPLKHEVVLGPGQISLRLTMERAFTLDGWHSGDGRLHFLSPHAASIEAAAEGLDVVNLLAHEHRILALDGHSYVTTPNLEAFSGQLAARERVFVNTLNTHPVLGKLALLHTHRPIYPLGFGEDHDEWSLFDWAAQCHRKKGLAVWVDAPAGGEALTAALLGQIDAIEFTAKSKLPWYYRLLNSGVCVPLIGSSGRESNATPLGELRTYARCDGSYEGWIEAVRAGDSFITGGPLLEWKIDGNRVTAQARSTAAFEGVQIVADGTVIASAAEEVTAVLDREPCWLAVRTIGPTLRAFSHSSPIRRGGAPPDSLAFLQSSLDTTAEWCRERGRYYDEKWRTQLLAKLGEAAQLIAAPPA